ncbi:hypothetical protein RRG08_049416 [Elysia crispata]|uniref:Uncharacterized protein n=1 Tax=Elysia crispata TaxID=231223 RepID=A0AAE1DLR2_9GAST|nr:hypothetical protein RRG08_049416 [Elysia crispata]
MSSGQFWRAIASEFTPALKALWPRQRTVRCGAPWCDTVRSDADTFIVRKSGRRVKMAPMKDSLLAFSQVCVFGFHSSCRSSPPTITARVAALHNDRQGKQHLGAGRAISPSRRVCHRLANDLRLRLVRADFTNDHFLKGHNYRRKVSLGIFQEPRLLGRRKRKCFVMVLHYGSLPVLRLLQDLKLEGTVKFGGQIGEMWSFSP